MAKKKGSIIRKARQQTGGGPEEKIKISPIEQDIWIQMSQTEIEGHSLIESEIDFVNILN